MNIHHSYLNCCTIANLKTRRRSNTLKGFQRMGGGRIFLNNLRDTTFNKDLWHEPNFARIRYFWTERVVPSISHTQTLSVISGKAFALWPETLYFTHNK
jgi:hypothetical protein